MPEPNQQNSKATVDVEVPEEAVKAAAEWLGGNQGWARKLLTDAAPAIRTEEREKVLGAQADLLDAPLVVLIGWESGPLDKLVDELDREYGGQRTRDRLDGRVQDVFGRKLVASRRDICDEYDTYPTKAGIGFVNNALRAALASLPLDAMEEPPGMLSPEVQLEEPCDRCGGEKVINKGRLSGWSKLPLERPCPDCGGITGAEVPPGVLAPCDCQPPDSLDRGGEAPEMIPASYWRPVPCGHPPDPVAIINVSDEALCHCGETLDPGDALPVEVPEAPGPIVHCRNCGCHVAIPKAPDCTDQPAPKEEEESDVSA